MAKLLTVVAVLGFAGVARADKPADPPRDPATCADQNACDNIAYDLKTTDPAGAAIANERACTFGEQYACREAAQAWADGTPGTKDLAKAFKLRERGCKLNERETCVDLGVAYLRGEGVAADAKKAVASLDKACKAGALLGCADLALIYHDGDTVKADANKAFTYSVKSCGDGAYDESAAEIVARGCEIAGLALVRGTGRKPNPTKALDYFVASCNRSKKYCFNLAVSIEKGNGTPADPERARQLFGRACDGEMADACAHFAYLAANGIGGSKDADLAKQAYAAACKLGDKESCNPTP